MLRWCCFLNQESRRDRVELILCLPLFCIKEKVHALIKLCKMIVLPESTSIKGLDQSMQQVHLFNTTVKLQCEHLSHVLYQKPSEQCAYLHASSFHPELTTKHVFTAKPSDIITSAQSDKIETPNSKIYKINFLGYNTYPIWLKHKLTTQDEYLEAGWIGFDTGH